MSGRELNDIDYNIKIGEKYIQSNLDEKNLRSGFLTGKKVQQVSLVFKIIKIEKKVFKKSSNDWANFVVAVNFSLKIVNNKKKLHFFP